MQALPETRAIFAAASVAPSEPSSAPSEHGSSSAALGGSTGSQADQQQQLQQQRSAFAVRPAVQPFGDSRPSERQLGDSLPAGAGGGGAQTTSNASRVSSGTANEVRCLQLAPRWRRSLWLLMWRYSLLLDHACAK